MLTHPFLIPLYLKLTIFIYICINNTVFSAMKRNLLILLAIITSINVVAQNDNIEAMKKMREMYFSEADETRESFNLFAQQAFEEYAEYEKKMKAEYAKYTSSIKNVWGENNVADDTNNKWVEYSDDFKSRSIVDFEEGSISIEVALDNIDDNNPAEVEQRLAEAIERTLESKGSSIPFSTEADKKHPLSQAPILDGLVDFSEYGIEQQETQPSAGANIKRERKAPPQPKSKSETLHFHDNQKNGTIARNENISKEEAIRRAENKLKAKIAAEKKAAAEGALKAKIAAEERIKAEEELRKLQGKEKKIEQKTEEKAKENVKKENKQSTSAKHKTEKKTVKEIANTIAKESNKSTTTIKGVDNKERKVVTVKLAMVTDNLSKNAALYKDYVKQYSQKFNIEEPLIYAIIEQESHFNPKAKSWVPAYGLMQLVPKSGGFDAYRYVYKREWVPTMSYLYVAHQNIELGTAYLRVLMNLFKNVTNAECRRLCVIASYNTGAGNVSRVFTGKTNLKKAIPEINKYSYEQLYTHLTNRLSTSEARNYVSGVSKKREKYIKK